jgi:NAD(P)-dependent dehydrogenase (short-subunit alcohol dehydrogenase family)
MTEAAPPRKVLLFGSTGAIGGAVAGKFSAEGWQVISVTRSVSTKANVHCWNPLLAVDHDGANAVCAAGPFDAICWAQGANGNDSVYQFDRAKHENLYQANVLYILESMHVLVSQQALAKPTRLCIVSSIWQQLARQEKLSYCVTKAALQGLVLSAANDLGRDGHLVNAVLPGVIDTAMTRKNLSPTQIDNVTTATQFRRLPTLQDVANAVFSLCNTSNTGITGQFVNVDLGYSHVRIV